jgi:GDP-L-fucose synthase
MKRKKILVTGADGLVGNSIRRLEDNYRDVYEFVFVTRQEADLTNDVDVDFLFASELPDYVIHTAAKVGGIGGNMAGHADYLHQNLLINAHVLAACHRYSVEKVLAFSSVCVFPDDLNVLQEDKMHDGPPFKANFAYAHAKRMVDVQIQALKSQHGVENYCSVIPGNIFGPNDMYNLEHGHVMPSLIHKMYLAKKDGTDFKVWGDGRSLREFIYVDDLAHVLMGLLQKQDIPDRLLVSGTQQFSIREMVDFLVEAAEFKGEVLYDADQPNGQRSRKSDTSRVESIFPGFQRTSVKDGVIKSYKWFEDNYPNVRK